MTPSGPIIWAEGKDVIEADIVFIHGLQGHALKTWSKGEVCWPRDILPHDLPHARIISWGYDSSDVNPTKRSIQASLFDHWENLLNDLCQLRSSPLAERRPIVFVGHSLGGLLIKEALIRSSEYASSNQHTDSGAIYTYTKGLVFLGTPHKGSEAAEIADTLSGIVKIGLQNPDDILVEVLAGDSQILERQMRSFTAISQRMPMACITEELETGTGMVSSLIVVEECVLTDVQVVPSQSATLQGNTVKTSSVPANHMEMCRFTKSEDIGYQRVSHHIITFVRQGAREELLQALAYKEMNDREDQITEAYPETFTWLVPTERIVGDNDLNPRFIEWIQKKHSSLYWLNGKAGSGKSTLMKNVFSNLSFRRLVEDWAKPAKVTFCGFFFFDRGKSMLQKSRNGMMRSVLHQIVSKHRDLGVVAFPKRYISWTLHDDPEPYIFDWTWQELSTAFSSILQDRDKTIRLCVFVDGLDEYSLTDEAELEADEEEDLITQRIERKSTGHTEIARIFLDVAKADNVKLCVSSRPLLRFENAFKGLLQMRLQDHTSADIATYVNGRLAQNEMMVDLTKRDPENAELLIDAIVERAAGVFLWVRLVVDRLLDSLEDHDSLIEMQRTVDSLPRELGGRKGLYIRMLEDMKPAFRVQAAKYFRIVQTTRNPLSLLSLSFLETEDIDSIVNMPVRQLNESEAKFESKWMEGRLKSRCVGLLEAVPLPPSRKKTLEKRRTLNARHKIKKIQCIEPQIMVQFLHQTAKEFLEQDFVWDMVFNQTAMQTFDVKLTLIGIGLLRLKKIGLDGIDSYDRLIGAWEIICDILWYASDLESDSKNIDKVERLLDNLDASAKILFKDMNSTGEKSSKFSHLHWTDTEPQESSFTLMQDSSNRNFFTLAVEFRLKGYVERKLEKGDVNLRRKRGILLLASTILPSSNTFRVRAADTDFSTRGGKKEELAMIEILLKHGADPNERIPSHTDGLSVWQAALRMSANNSSQNHLVDIYKLLIRYGANPSTRVQGLDLMESALKVITQNFRHQPEICLELVNFLEAKGGRPRSSETEELIKTWNELQASVEASKAEVEDRSQLLSFRDLDGDLFGSRWREYMRRFNQDAEWSIDDYWKLDSVNPKDKAEDEEARKLNADIEFHLRRLEELEKKRLEPTSSNQTTMATSDKSGRLRVWHI